MVEKLQRGSHGARDPHTSPAMQTPPSGPSHADTVVKASTAPEPDDPRKPARLTQLTPNSWWYAFRRAVHSFLVGIDTDTAGTLTYFSVLSIFPALLALLTLVSLLGQGQATADWILRLLATHVAPDVVEFLRDPVMRLTHAPGAGWVLLFSLAVALWGASGYVGAFGRALNHVYDVTEGRPIWVIIPYNLMVTAIVLVFGAAAMLSILFSTAAARTLGSYVGLASETVQFWSLLRWPILIFVALFYISALHFATPNVRLPIRLVTPGTVLSLVTMAAVGWLFNTYVTVWGTWNETYGVVGSVIVLLLGLWLVNCMLLFGCEFDAELERVRELQGGIAAEESIQLPPRDVRVIEQIAADHERFVAEGRRIREQHNPDADSAA